MSAPPRPPQPPAGENYKVERAQWNDIMRAYLLKLLHEHSEPRWRGQNGWTKEAWLNISEAFNLKFPNASLRRNQIKEQEQQMKKIYRVLKKLSETSGFRWDYTNHMVTASDDVWQTLLEVDKEARKWHKRSWPHYTTCQELYEGRFAKGKQSSDPEDYRARPASQLPSSPHQSSPEEASPVPTIPALRAASQPFHEEQELEEFGDTNMNPQRIQAPTPTQPSPHRRTIPESHSPTPSQMSDNTSNKRRKSSKSVTQDFTDRYIAMREREMDRFIHAMEKARQAPEDRYSIPRCIEVFNVMEGFTNEDMLKATTIFEKETKRQIFLSLRIDQREIWLRAEMDKL